MKERIQAIVDQYEIGVAGVEPITKGFLSENYKVIGLQGDQYFLKQYRAALDEARVVDIHKSKYFFAERGIPVVLPLTAANGASYVTHEGKFYALFPFLEGNNYPDQHCSPEELRSLARMLARVHIVGAAAEPGYIEKKFQRQLIHDAIVHADKVIDVIQNHIAQHGAAEFDHAALRIARRKRELLADWPFAEEPMAPQILVHYDLHAGNAFFDDSGEARHVFDFELTQYEPAAFDVVRTMTIVCMDYGTREEKWKRVQDYLRAYRELRPMSDEELRAGIVEFILYRSTSFWVEEERYLKNNTRVDRFLECDDESRILWLEALEKYPVNIFPAERG